MDASDEAGRLVAVAADRGDVVLDLGNLGLRELPAGLRELTDLRELLLNGNELSGLPDWLGSLTGLSKLHLGRNRLTSLPGSLRALVGLTSLHLGGNQLGRLPEWIGDLAYLESLHLESNGLTELPGWLLKLRRLTLLDIGGNGLAELPGWFSGLGSLSAIHLYRNGMTQLPDPLRGIPALSALYLNGNKLAGLPGWLGELSRLNRLHCYGNQLATLPASIGSLTGLGVLDLKANRLTQVPDPVRGLVNLATLDLEENELTTLPQWLGDLQNLTRLAVRGNPLKSPPEEICGAGTPAILAYLRALREGADEQWHSKMLVVGEARVGKTSVVRALRGKPFDPEGSPTRGVEIGELDLGEVPQTGDRARLTIWDFGGQLEYRATQRFYLTDRSLFLLVWNMEGGPETHGQVDRWLETVRNAAPRSPVVIAGTHCAGRVSDLDAGGLRRRFPNIAAIAEVDCKSGTGIAELREELAGLARALPLMGQPWPRPWARAADQLAGQPEMFISLDHAFNLLRQAGVREPAQQAALLGVLHDRGDILHFTQANLRDVVILRPSWVDEMVTRVLDSHQVGARGGLLSRAHRAELWDDVKDTGIRDMLVDIMVRFRLAYRIGGPDDEDIALVVERLHVEEPAEARRLWNHARAAAGNRELRVTYRLPIRPAGIPAWFIAQEHRFTTGTAWRHGAVLHRTEDGYGRRAAWALLEDDGRDQPTIRLVVCGDDPLDFRQALDDGLRRVLDNYPGLQYKKLVPCTCSDNAGTTCGYEFPYDLVRRFADQARVPIQCHETGVMVDPRALLYGLQPYREQVYLESIRDEIAGTRAEFRARFDRVDDGLLWLRNRIRDLLQIGRADEVEQYPRLFMVTQIGRPQKYELHLWCESPDNPHPLPADIGVHRFVRTPDWLRPYAPWLLTALKILMQMAPLVGPSLGAVGEQISDQVASALELSTSLLADLAGYHVTTIGAELDRPPRTNSQIREFCEQLRKITDGYRGLHLSEIPEYKDSVFYLCDEHRRQLEHPAHFDVP